MAVMRQTRPAAEPSRRETMEERVRTLESPLLAYGVRLVGQSEIADDLVQEASMRFCIHIRAGSGAAQIAFGTVHNLALNNRRDSRK